MNKDPKETIFTFADDEISCRITPAWIKAD